MSKKQFLELLLKSYGLTPKGVHHYRTDGNGGEFEVGVGWEGHGEDKNGNWIIQFAVADGFNMAVYEILKQASDKKLHAEFIF